MWIYLIITNLTQKSGSRPTRIFSQSLSGWLLELFCILCVNVFEAIWGFLNYVLKRLNGRNWQAEGYFRGRVLPSGNIQGRVALRPWADASGIEPSSSLGGVQHCILPLRVPGHCRPFWVGLWRFSETNSIPPKTLTGCTWGSFSGQPGQSVFSSAVPKQPSPKEGYTQTGLQTLVLTLTPQTCSEELWNMIFPIKAAS